MLLHKKLMKNITVSLLGLSLIAPLACGSASAKRVPHHHTYNTAMYVGPTNYVHKDKYGYKSLQRVKKDAETIKHKAMSKKYHMSKRERRAFIKEANKLYREATQLENED